MGSIWDSKLTDVQRGPMGLAPYANITALFKAMPYNPNNQAENAIGDKLSAALTSKGTFLDTLNGDFAHRLDKALADPAIRNKIADLAEHNPVALNAQMNNLMKAPEMSGQILAAISPPPVAVPSTSASTETASNAPHHTAKHHFRTAAAPPAGDDADDTPVVTAATTPPAKPADQTAGTLPPNLQAQVDEAAANHPTAPSGQDSGLGGIMKSLFSTEMGAGIKSFLTDNPMGKFLGMVLAMFIPGLDKLLGGAQGTDANGQPSTSLVSNNNGSLTAENKGLQASGGAVKNEVTGQTLALGANAPRPTTAADPLPPNLLVMPRASVPA